MSIDGARADFPEWKGGDCVGGFEIRRQLGDGAFGRVFLAFNKTLKMDVAIKAIPGGEAQAREIDGAKIMRELSHKAIVRVFSVECRSGCLLIEMEYLAGGSLRDRLREQGSLKQEEVVRIGASVLDALQSIHDHDFLHLDLKPGNILFDGAGHAKVSDFGVSSSISRVMKDEVRGARGYMAPEQAEGKPEKASDIYAVGVILFEMLSGSRPERIGGRISSMEGVPEAFRGVLLRFLDIAPGGRWASAAKAREALERCLADPDGSLCQTCKQPLPPSGVCPECTFRSGASEREGAPIPGLESGEGEEGDALPPGLPWRIPRFAWWAIDRKSVV